MLWNHLTRRLYTFPFRRVFTEEIVRHGRRCVFSTIRGGTSSNGWNRFPKEFDSSILSGMALLSIVAAASSLTCMEEPFITELETDDTATTTLWNWSGTHAVQVPNERYWEPESIAEVEAIVRQCHERGQFVRPIGSALSPNGLAFSPDGMISLAHLDHIVAVHEGTVTVQAGARVAQVVDALREHGLTLPNLASIAEQQMGGFTQIGAHGTGATLAPVDHYITQLKMVTPGKGTITLTEQDGELFHMAKVGLGCLGVVVEITMECVPAHWLEERTRVLTRQQAKEQVNTLLAKHRHVRYMWIPYTDAVVCVTNDVFSEERPLKVEGPLTAQSTKYLLRRATLRPRDLDPSYTSEKRLKRDHSIDDSGSDDTKVEGPLTAQSTKYLLRRATLRPRDLDPFDKSEKLLKRDHSIDDSGSDDFGRRAATQSAAYGRWFKWLRSRNPDLPEKNPYTPQERLQPMVDLLLEVAPAGAYTDDMIANMGFGALRDAILAVRPLDLEHVKRCNQAEAAFWQRCHDTTVIKPSDELLQFDCGGQQWVWEVCFPTGTQQHNTGADMRFMEQLLHGIEEERSIPAPAPLEQRWSASSSSYMSPAYGPPDGLHSWVGIINYLPPGATPEQEMLQRQEITALFLGPYCDLMRSVGKEFDATSHWAKLEPPKSVWQLVDLQLFLATRFPLERFNRWRAELDPKNILASPLMNLLLGKPEPKP